MTLSESIELKGKIINADDGLPVAGAYVYTVEGEEEAITGELGEFKLTTWNSYPFLLTVKHSKYHSKQLRITSNPKYLQIKLKKK
ncbi:MAG: carboxypeptidase-like regulatory domain-containing protein [Chitinophagaceae bacterium]